MILRCVLNFNAFGFWNASNAFSIVWIFEDASKRKPKTHPNAIELRNASRRISHAHPNAIKLRTRLHATLNAFRCVLKTRLDAFELGNAFKRIFNTSILHFYVHMDAFVCVFESWCVQTRLNQNCFHSGIIQIPFSLILSFKKLVRLLY